MPRLFRSPDENSRQIAVQRANRAAAKSRKKRRRVQGPSALALEGKEILARVGHMRMAGLTYAAIGARLGLSRGDVEKLGQQYLDIRTQEVAENALDLRAMENARLDAMFFPHFKAAIKGDVRATKVALAIQERRAKLMGLDAKEPPQVQQTNVTILSDEQLVEMRRIIDGARLAGTYAPTSGLAQLPPRENLPRLDLTQPVSGYIPCPVEPEVIPPTSPPVLEVVPTDEDYDVDLADATPSDGSSDSE